MSKEPQETKEKHAGGRPRYEFTEEQIAKMDEMALMNCNNHTIAVVLGVEDETLIDQFIGRITQKRGEHRFNLRKNQAKISESNPAMAIFLGKNVLEQTDKQEVVHDIGKQLAVTLLEFADGKDTGLPSDNGRD